MRGATEETRAMATTPAGGKPRTLDDIEGEIQSGDLFLLRWTTGFGAIVDAGMRFSREPSTAFQHCGIFVWRDDLPPGSDAIARSFDARRWAPGLRWREPEPADDGADGARAGDVGIGAR